MIGSKHLNKKIFFGGTQFFKGTIDLRAKICSWTNVKTLINENDCSSVFGFPFFYEGSDWGS